MVDRLVVQVCFTEDSDRARAYLGGYLQCPGGYKYIYYLSGFHIGLLTIGVKIVMVGKTFLEMPSYLKE